MMSVEVVGIAFVLIFFSELGDKTQLLAISLASRYDHRAVFTAVASALIVATIIAVVVGGFIFSVIPLVWIRIAAATLFLAFGTWTLLIFEEEETEEFERGRRIFPRAFALTFAAEMGDKTQLAAVALTASYGAPIEVFAGAAIGFVAVTAIGVVVGKWLGRHINERWMSLGGGILFVIIGLVILAESLSI